MKKWISFYGFLMIFLAVSVQSRAQGNIRVNAPAQGVKSVSKARSIALTNTLSPMGLGIGSVVFFENNTFETAGAALAVYGLVVGPSTGNFYAEDYQRGALGMAVRTAGVFLMADATREIFGNDFANALTVDDKEVSLLDTKILIGEVLVLGSIIYNVVSTQASVNKYNTSRARFSLQLQPADLIGDKVAPVLTAKVRL